MTELLLHFGWQLFRFSQCFQRVQHDQTCRFYPQKNQMQSYYCSKRQISSSFDFFVFYSTENYCSKRKQHTSSCGSFIDSNVAVVQSQNVISSVSCLSEIKTKAENRLGKFHVRLIIHNESVMKQQFFLPALL